MDPRVQKLAEILVNYSVRVKPEDWVIIRGNVVGLPLINEVSKATLKAGGYPNIVLSTDELTETYYREANETQLKWVSPFDTLQYQNANVIIEIRAASNTRNLSGIDIKKQNMQKGSRLQLRQIFNRRTVNRELRWVTTEFPCEAFAQEADMSLKDYQDFVFQATLSDKPNPVALWQEVFNNQQKFVDWLKGKNEVVVRGPNVDLRLSIKNRSFVNSAGFINMPDGEIFTGPVENSVNGWVKFSFPSLRDGHEVDGAVFTFKDGKIVDAKADRNEAYLISQLDTDIGARYLGEFALGTNYSIRHSTKNILYDEKIGGTLHMAVGLGYPETGSKNISAIHWDFICDLRKESEILVDGELFFKNGEFQV